MDSKWTHINMSNIYKSRGAVNDGMCHIWHEWGTLFRTDTDIYALCIRYISIAPARPLILTITISRFVTPRVWKSLGRMEYPPVPAWCADNYCITTCRLFRIHDDVWGVVVVSILFVVISIYSIWWYLCVGDVCSIKINFINQYISLHSPFVVSI